MHAINVLSSENIVHSDIKPDNLLITADENKKNVPYLKVIDFGSSFFVTDR